MAGIGFELKSIFKEDSISRIAGGIVYSTLVTVGPTVIVIATIMALYLTLGLVSVPYAERELLSSTILYVFIFSLLTTSAFNGVMSRYIADKIYEEKYEDILPSFYTGIFLNTLVGAIFGIPFILRVIFIGGVDPIFAFVSYCFFIVMIITFYSMIYLSATKDYKIIAIYYTIGMIVTFISANLFNKFGLSIIEAILYGLTLGFLIIAFLEFAYMRKYFNSNSKNYKDCLHYFADHKKIFFCNLLYTLGLYIHNFVFWTHPSHIIVAKSYVSMQSYDMASCLAMFTNISTIIIFTVMAETNFHNKYQKYNEAVIGKTWKDITVAKKSLFRLLVQQVSHLAGMQAIITTTIFFIAIILMPNLGFGGSVLAIYPSLVCAFFAIFLMYCNIIYMFYFNDNTGAMYTSIIFCVCVLLGSIFSIRLSESLYGLGAFIGAFIGWSFSFYRIKYMEKHFDEHIFCKTSILRKKVGKMPESRVYVRK
ncbi:exopolysaccharide Pel transporter PelG [Oceanirhabdus sp. W0125-5]|uniref:exopolysaccharide Pel transporter PelG n=1 Tax=Oceanirhabdus sp. W0125-5 TaxID=2999116 RepID=UPI0022F2F5A0|nr:exopolysaccharide Pel transporter PelG [Oceanirhabdus sp. W0125-5]WBW98609.1 exopolysaccharide Pel transporter PelG [Oceanirhabdus sp. W0125-5]